MSAIKHPIKFKLKEFLMDNAPKTFLIGAGCSIEPPSCLPAGRKMIEAIINYTCIESEIEKILTLEGLRFEALVEIVRDRLDPDLRLIDYLGVCDKPNLQHFFLAEMIKRGHFLMTTNFDFLIEYALLQAGVPKKDIVPVITKKDFIENDNPNELFKKGKKTVYKIHGSTKNIITNESTRDSLIATIQAFGSNKEGETVFQLESFKQPAFLNLIKGRSLVIMGYSGSDDFDIVPTLKILKNLKTIFWVNFVYNDHGTENIIEIFIETDPSFDKFKKVNQILLEIKRMSNIAHVYRIDVNTSRLVKELIPTDFKLSLENFATTPTDWLKNNIEAPNKIMKFQIPYKIYRSLDKIDDALRCTEKVLEISEESDDLYSKGTALNNIGEIYRAQGNYPKALKCYEKALQIDTQLDNLSGKASIITNIGLIYHVQGKYPEALKCYEEALQINEQLGDQRGKYMILNNIGMIYKMRGKYIEALKQFIEALQIDTQLGDLHGKIMVLNNIGEIYRAQGNYAEALKRYDEALQIAQQLSDLHGKAAVLNNIGLIYEEQEKYPEALKQYKEALQIDTQLGDLRGQAAVLNNIGSIYYAQGNYLKALKWYEETLQIDELLGDLREKAKVLNNIGEIYRVRENYPEALNRYEEALQIAIQLGDLRGKAMDLNNIGSIYYTQGNYPEALKRYEEALQIDTQLDDLRGKAIRLNNIGLIYYEQENYPKALKQYKEALQIDTQLGNLRGKALVLNNIGEMYDEQENYPEALNLYEEALQILIQLRLHNSPLTKTIEGNINSLRKKSNIK
ncbi:MAG: tetratricopeptide repeat protein [Promethearchaeota archaeon]